MAHNTAPDRIHEIFDKSATEFDFDAVERALQVGGEDPEVEARAREVAVLMWRQIFDWVSEPLLFPSRDSDPFLQSRAVASRVLATMRLFTPKHPALGTLAEAGASIGCTKQACGKVQAHTAEHFAHILRAKRGGPDQRLIPPLR